MNRQFIAYCISVCLICAFPLVSFADEVCDGANYCYERDGTRKYLLQWLKSLISGEDVINDVLKVETRYTNIPVSGTTSRIANDQLYKSGPGYVRNISCFSDAAATAGTIILYDNTAAGSGNIIWSFDVQAIGYPIPFVVPLEVSFITGLFLDFTTTNDMFCTVSYR